MSFTNETWEWLKTAPLPVVLAICLSLFSILGAYAYSIDDRARKHEVQEQATVAVAAEQARQAAEVAKNMDGKLDKLLTIVVKMETQHEAEAQAKAKKEKK